MRKRNVWLLIILAIFAASLWAVLPLNGERFGRQGLRLGLDLVGGVHLVYQVNFPAGTSETDKTQIIDRAVLTIQNRIDRYGVTDPVIQRLGTDRMLVQLPGFTDIDTAKSLVEQTGFLEFRRVELNSGQVVTLANYLVSSSTDFFDKGESGSRLFVDPKGNPAAFMTRSSAGAPQFTDADGKPIDASSLQNYSDSLAWITARGNDGTPLTGGLLAEATPEFNTTATGTSPQVAIKWNAQGSTIFDQVASRIYNSGQYGTPQRSLGIFLDNRLISDPQILESVYHGSAVITGNFTVADVQRMSTLLQSGALPVPLSKPPLYQEKVSATLGANFIDASVKAGIIGILLVMLFMMVYYRMCGVVATLTLLFYSSLVIAILKLWPVTLNLAGLGGFIVSVGMAVDANVLIFERMKEEFRRGRTLGAAIDAGFDRAWSAIRDSNLTTFIACIILYWLGSSVVASGPVMSFAITLFIGVAVSMFSAVTVSRTLLQMFVGTGLSKKTSWFSANWGKK